MQRTDRGTDRVVDLRPVADLLAHTVGGTVDDLFAGRRQVEAALQRAMAN
jgi:hypothetical protein